MPPKDADYELPEFCVERPVAALTETEEQDLRFALDEVLKDPVLMAPFWRFAALETNAVEIFNGALDTSWHHDGLAGKRGHAGEFFLLVYFNLNETSGWDPSWGGAFEFGERDLAGDWVHEIEAPSETRKIWPEPRTAVFGWNGNPKLVHRSAPMEAARDRYVLAASIRARTAADR